MEPGDPKEIASEISRLRKSGKIAEAAVLGESALLQFPQNWSIMNSLVWVIYDKDVKTAKEGKVQPEKLPDILRRVEELQSHSLYGEISAYVFTVLELSKVLNDANLHGQALAMLQEVDRTKLSSESQNFGGRRLPSQKYRFYMLVSGLLFDLGRLVETVEMCDEALVSAAVKNEGDRKWFRYRRALALEETNPSEALDEINRFLVNSFDWWAIQIRARILGSTGKSDACLLEYGRALGQVDPKEFDKGIKLISEYALLATDVDMRKDLLQSVRSIRLAQNWKSDTKIEGAATALGLSDPASFDYRAALKRHSIDSPADNTRRIPRVTDQVNIVIEVALGKVKLLLEGNPQGFLTIDGFGDCYFRGSDNPNLKWPPQIGQLIRGKVIESFDATKGRMSNKFINGTSGNL